ncbi:acetylglutamate kinase [Streptomyces hirsutus]
MRNGVTTARVIDGRVQHSILLEIFTDEGIGTMVVPDGTPDETPEAAVAAGAPHAQDETPHAQGES